ncbi:MAG: alpha/beta fold hydrolase [Thermoproteota archaeon]
MMQHNHSHCAICKHQENCNGLPYFWPVFCFVGCETTEALRKNLEFLKVVDKTLIKRPEPKWSSKNKIRIELDTVSLRDFSKKQKKGGVYTLILAPYAGHTSQIADYDKGQSLVETFQKCGIEKVAVTDWKSATQETKDYDIDNYLYSVDACVEELGGVANLVGLCQGGWLGAMYAARFPERVNTLTLAGSPIDTDAGDGQIKEFAHTYPMSFYEELVAMGNGVLKGEFMLRGFKNMHPGKQYIEKYVELYKSIDDKEYLKKFEKFESWYEYTIDLPGRFYLQVVKELFKENRLVKGEFIGLGKRLDLKDIKCPVYLLAGERDDITPVEQVLDAEKYLGTDKKNIKKDIADGGHIGLFMGHQPLEENWPKIVKWIKKYSWGET